MFFLRPRAISSFPDRSNSVIGSCGSTTSAVATQVVPSHHHLPSSENWPIATPAVCRVLHRGIGEAGWGTTDPTTWTPDFSHVVVHVVIGGSETARNRSNRMPDASN